MPTLLFRCLIFLLVSTSTFILTNAQEPTGKVIEVQSSHSPRPSVIALSRERSSGFWGSRFARLKDWKIPETGDPVHAVDFSARLVGDKAELIISLFSGKRFGENREIVARVLISEGETMVVSELKKFGFEPVTVKMLATATAVADVPLVINPAPLLRTTVGNVVATLPTFKVSFRNESKKDILAFEWHTETNGRKLLSGIQQGKFGNPLIEVDGSFEMNIIANKQLDDLNPVTLVIGAVVFRDGSFEGDPKAAETFLAFTDGRKKALDQLVPLLVEATKTRSQRPDISGLVTKVDGLSDGVPFDKKSATAAQIAFAGVIKDALVQLRQIDSESSGKNDDEVMMEMSKLASFYRDWQSRMTR